jgi:hypothetical protein
MKTSNRNTINLGFLVILSPKQDLLMKSAVLPSWKPILTLMTKFRHRNDSDTLKFKLILKISFQ